jgi:hypothetical protein
LVGIAFGSRGESGTDDPHPVFASVGVRQEQDPVPLRSPDRDGPPFVSRMIRIVERERKRIRKRTRGLAKRDAVLLQIGGRLLRIPLVDHTLILRQLATVFGIAFSIVVVARIVASPTIQ